MGGVRIVLFSDLVDSTALLARMGDDRMEQLRRTHVEDVNAAVARSGGRLVKTLGDGATTPFGEASDLRLGWVSGLVSRSPTATILTAWQW